MIEAVNSVVSNAPFLRGSAQQTGASAASVANTQTLQTVESSASAEQFLPPYISLYIEVDNNFDEAVLQVRDSDTGDVIRQFPSESRLAQQAAEASVDAKIAERASQNASREAQAVIEQASVTSQTQQGSAPEVSAPAPAPVAAPANTGQAQIASAALVAGSQAANTQSSSGGVSVVA